MADPNPQTKSSVDDFEMGETGSSTPPSPVTPDGKTVEAPQANQPTQPIINRYDNSQSIIPTQKKDVNPKDGMPAQENSPVQTTPQAQPIAPVTVAPAPVAPQTSPAMSAAPGQPQAKPPANMPPQIPGAIKPPMPKAVPPDPVARKKAIIGCLGGFGALLIIFLILAFVFIIQGDQDSNPIAKLLGLNTGTFVNSLITFVHLIFIIIALATFVFTMIGLFRASMAKKDDKLARQEGLKMALFSGIVFFIVLVIWIFVYLYLDTKRVKGVEEILAPIITVPEDTLNLSAPVEIKFDASNVPIDTRKYQIVSHDWDFGDGNKNTSQIVSNIYEEKGTYDVALKITVKDKKTGEISIGGEYHTTVSITNEALSAVFTATPQSGEAPLEVKLDGTTSVDPDGIIERYEWDLDGDGEFDDADGKEITHKFEKIGKYKVSLRVTTTIGDYDVADKEIEVKKGELPIPVITVVDEPETYVIGNNYVFKADASSSPNGKITQYSWDFNDGQKAKNTKSVSYSFSKEGTYEITLKIKDEKDKEAEITKNIIIGSPKGTPRADISTKPQLSDSEKSLRGSVPFSVIFSAQGSKDSDNNIVDYGWDFDGDGENDGFGETISHTFTEEGIYNVTLHVSDSDDNIGTATLVIEAQAQGIKAVLEADTIEGHVPMTVNFNASGSSYAKGQITSYKWDFGDNSAAKLGAATISHKYTTVGSYNASVQVIGADNKSDTAKINITVREIPLKACFVSVFEEGPAPLETSFDPGCSTGTIVNYLWDFGDGSTSTKVKPGHVFKDPGKYHVTLEATDAENTVSKAELFITVTN